MPKSSPCLYTQVLNLTFSVIFLVSSLSACTTPKSEPSATLVPGSSGFPWWNDTTFYEIFVRSFYDSDGDGIGDFNGIIEKLDYLNDGNPETSADLGITGIWLMPIHPSPSYHGYDITDYNNVNPQYGTLDDFKRLLDEAHKRGIRIIIDLVLNHTSNEHPWFKAALDPSSNYRDFYVWSDTNPGGAGWYAAPSGGGYYFSSFINSMPDLNYKNPAVSMAMKDVVRFWLDMGVDGYRLDAAKHLIEEGVTKENTPATHEWLASLRELVKDTSPQAMLIGEIWSDTAIVSSYLQGDQLDLAFDFDLAKAMVTSAGLGKAGEVARILIRDTTLFKPGQYASFLTNHDQDRVMYTLGNSTEKAMSAASLLLTTPGVPFIYYGEEIGMVGSKPDPRIRTSMQWSGKKNAGFTRGVPWRGVNADYKNKNVADSLKDENSLLSHYRSLVHLRNAHPALRIGDYLMLERGNTNVFAFIRYSHSPDEILLVLINLNAEAVSDYGLILAEGLPAGDYHAQLLYSNPTGKANLPSTPVLNDQGGFDAYQPFATLPPFTTLIIQLNPSVQP